MTHPFVTETTVDRSCIGREPRIDRSFNMAAFVRALAPLLDAAIDEKELEQAYAIGHISLANGLNLYISSCYGAKMGRVEISVGSSVAHKLDTYARPNMPSASFDASRPLNAIAKVIKSKIIEPALPIHRGMVDKAKERDNTAQDFGALIATFNEKYPGLSVQRKNASDLSADVYLNSKGSYLYGTLSPDGRVNIQRLSLGSAGETEKLFALLTGEGSNQ